jgi:hypothetical protein
MPCLWLGCCSLLTKDDNDATTIREMMSECWAVLSKKSPNPELPSPTVHFSMVCDNDERDMQAILQRLIVMAHAAGRNFAPDCWSFAPDIPAGYEDRRRKPGDRM